MDVCNTVAEKVEESSAHDLASLSKVERSILPVVTSIWSASSAKRRLPTVVIAMSSETRTITHLPLTCSLMV